MQTRNRKRLQLILIASLFLIPMLVAAVLTFSGWVPGTRSYGTGIVPQRTLDAVEVRLADGGTLVWRDPDWRWSLVALAGPNCAEGCLQQLDWLERARLSLNQNADRVRLVYIGAAPEASAVERLKQHWTFGEDTTGGLREWTPTRADGLSVLLVKPDAVALTWYADGFDPNGLRKDLKKVLK